jgi:hypothetical protein
MSGPSEGGAGSCKRGAECLQNSAGACEVGAGTYAGGTRAGKGGVEIVASGMGEKRIDAAACAGRPSSELEEMVDELSSDPDP